MKKISVIILSCLMIISIAFIAVNAKAPKAPKWNTYTCDVLPGDESLASMIFQTSNIAGEKFKNEIVADTEISGNKMLAHSNELDSRMQWKHELSNIKGTTTFVIRAKAIDVGKYANSFEIDIHMQPKSYREKIAATAEGKIKLTYAKVESTETVDTSKWHIYRITLDAKEVKVYVDENEKPIVTAPVSSTSTKEDYFRFGSSDRGTTFGCYYDWIIWTIDGAFAPSAAAVPDTLTGIKK